MSSGEKKYSFLWFIENYSYCGRYFEEEFVSPEFTQGRHKGAKWVLRLFPGRLGKDINSIHLERSAFDAGPESFSLNLEISVITADGSTLYSEECEHTFRKGAERGFKPFLVMDELYVRRNTEYLPEDTLGVRCRMWNGEGSVHNVLHTARTRIGIEKISFLHRVKNFSALKLREKKTLQIPSHLKTGCVISSSLYVANFYNYLVSEDTVIVEIVPSNSNYTLFRKQLSLLHVNGNTIKCGEVDYRFFCYKEDIKKLNQSLTRQLILTKRAEYLPNDQLSLLCECTFSAGVEFNKIEEIQNEIPMTAYKGRYYNRTSTNDSKIAKSLCARPTVPEDMDVNPHDQRLSNVELKANSFSGFNNAPSIIDFAALNQMANNDPHNDKYNATEKLSSKTSTNDSKIAKRQCVRPTVTEDMDVNPHDQRLPNVELKANSFSGFNNAPSIIDFEALNQMTNNDPHKDQQHAAEILSTCSSALDDFKALYNDQLLTDAVLKTATKSFSTHKIVLCARSSVFRAMLTSDMNEKNTAYIEVYDLENEIAQQLLIFLYSDNLEELRWESALKLYRAGEKYAIKKLKVLCSSFLVDNLSTSTASELLLLADTHSDRDLKKFVEDFILEHEKEVFGSDEWEKLIETNPQLVMKTMHLKYKREKGGK